MLNLPALCPARNLRKPLGVSKTRPKHTLLYLSPGEGSSCMGTGTQRPGMGRGGTGAAGHSFGSGTTWDPAPWWPESGLRRPSLQALQPHTSPGKGHGRVRPHFTDRKTETRGRTPPPLLLQGYICGVRSPRDQRRHFVSNAGGSPVWGAGTSCREECAWHQGEDSCESRAGESPPVPRGPAGSSAPGRRTQQLADSVVGKPRCPPFRCCQDPGAHARPEPGAVAAPASLRGTKLCPTRGGGAGVDPAAGLRAARGSPLQVALATRGAG